jgi:hypothetical protein
MRHTQVDRDRQQSLDCSSMVAFPRRNRHRVDPRTLAEASRCFQMVLVEVSREEDAGVLESEFVVGHYWRHQRGHHRYLDFEWSLADRDG